MKNRIDLSSVHRSSRATLNTRLEKLIRKVCAEDKRAKRIGEKSEDEKKKEDPYHHHC